MKSVVTATSYIEGLAAGRRATAKMLGPGDTLELDASGPSLPGRVTVPSVALATSDPNVATLWPLDRPGRYELTASVAVTPDDAIANPCAGESAVATRRFVVHPQRSGTPGWMVVAGGLVAGGLVIAAVWIAFRRRTLRRGGAASMVALLVGAVLVVTAARADAKIERSGSADFKKAVDACFGKFFDAGDPGSAFRRAADARRTVKIQERVPIDGNRSASGSSTTPENLGDASDPNKGSDSVIDWNFTDSSSFADGVPKDPCSELYHELSHGADAVQGADNGGPCDSTGDSVAEVKATLNENKYRAKQGLPTRTMYTHKLPDSFDKCKDRPSRSGRGGRRHDCPSGSCGSSSGDPHLRTFDQGRYDLQQVGEFVLARSSVGRFEVQVRQRPSTGSRIVSVVSAAAMRIGADRLGIYPAVGGALRITLNGSAVRFPSADVALPGGATLYVDDTVLGKALGIETDDGTVVSAAPLSAFGIDVEVAPSPRHAGRFSGLLGNFDGRPGNDLVSRAGEPLSASPAPDEIRHRLGDGWRVSASESLFDYQPGESTATFTDRSFPDSIAAPSDEARRAAETVCRWAGVTDPSALTDCIFDVAVTGDRTFADAAAGRAAAAVVDRRGGSKRSIALGAGVSGTVQPDEDIRYTFNATSGETIFFEHQVGECIPWELLEPGGTQLVNGGVCLDSGPITIKTTGAHRFVIHGQDTENGHYRFRFIEAAPTRTAALAIGDTVAGHVATKGATAIYTFHATAGQTIFFEHQVGECIAWELLDPRSTRVAGGGLCLDLGPITIKTTGVHRFAIRRGSAENGDYRFRFIEAAPTRTAALRLGETIAGHLDTKGATAIYTFHVTAGQTIFFEHQVGECIPWELLDPRSTRVAGGGLCLDLGPITIKTTGVHRFVIRRGSAEIGDYRFRIRSG